MVANTDYKSWNLEEMISYALQDFFTDTDVIIRELEKSEDPLAHVEKIASNILAPDRERRNIKVEDAQYHINNRGEAVWPNVFLQRIFGWATLQGKTDIVQLLLERTSQTPFYDLLLNDGNTWCEALKWGSKENETVQNILTEIYSSRESLGELMENRGIFLFYWLCNLEECEDTIISLSHLLGLAKKTNQLDAMISFYNSKPFRLLLNHKANKSIQLVFDAAKGNKVLLEKLNEIVKEEAALTMEAVSTLVRGPYQPSSKYQGDYSSGVYNHVFCSSVQPLEVVKHVFELISNTTSVPVNNRYDGIELRDNMWPRALLGEIFYLAAAAGDNDVLRYLVGVTKGTEYYKPMVEFNDHLALDRAAVCGRHDTLEYLKGLKLTDPIENPESSRRSSGSSYSDAFELFAVPDSKPAGLSTAVPPPPPPVSLKEPLDLFGGLKRPVVGANEVTEEQGLEKSSALQKGYISS